VARLEILFLKSCLDHRNGSTAMKETKSRWLLEIAWLSAADETLLEEKHL
jgi:hypothetical protein